jgi:hypothetical protein
MGVVSFVVATAVLGGLELVYVAVTGAQEVGLGLSIVTWGVLVLGPATVMRRRGNWFWRTTGAAVFVFAGITAVLGLLAGWFGQSG